jgi:carboxymethylenebutenolidase
MKTSIILTIAPVALLALRAAPLTAQDAVKARLDKSPRHHEWVEIQQGDRKVHTFVVFPEVKEKATAVVVIHENKGLTDWVRSVADQLAEAGYIAVAPDLLSGMASGGGKTTDFKSVDDATKAIYALPPNQVTADLNAVADYAAKIPAANGKVAVAGFCWGGAQTFRFATNRDKLAAAFVFYGTGTESAADAAKINCPVYGFYGGNDERVNATIPKSTAAMKQAGKTYDPLTYEGAGHGFMRVGEEASASEANKKAREQAWVRWKQLLKKISA